MKTKEFQEIVILANGALPRRRELLTAWWAADQIVATDGAYRKAGELGRVPDFVIGDGDSLTADDRAELGERFIHVSEQETNDLAKALRFIRDSHKTDASSSVDVVILGATGLREDHTLANIFLLGNFVSCFHELSLLTETGIFRVIVPNVWHEYQSRLDIGVSFFPVDIVDKTIHAQSQGLKWPLDGKHPEFIYSWTLNRATGKRFAVRTDHPLIMFTEYC